jgi:hypothetical protein
MANHIKIVLFEDTPGTQSAIALALIKYLKQDGIVIPFDSGEFQESKADGKRMYEARLEKILRKPPYDEATLIVADQDLSKSPEFVGLSVNAVAAASSRMSIPICSYSRQAEQGDYEWRGRWEEGHIVLRLSEGEDGLARQAVLAARGFAEIAGQIADVMEVKASNSPAKILAALLDKPEYTDKIALYSVGDQNRLSAILPHSKQSKARVQRRMTYFLGYWLWDSLLRYPGLLVNDVAAASYLNIATISFRDSNVQGVFKKALYHGPFSDAKQPRWWRGVLDDVVSHHNCVDGLELVRKKVSSTIRRSQCCVDSSKTAGYYCIISRLPVSLENSKGGLSWFPRGADLTRISTTKFQEYGPWLGA